MKEEKNKVGRPRLADTNLKKNSIIMIEIAIIGIISLIIGGIFSLTSVNSKSLDKLAGNTTGGDSDFKYELISVQKKADNNGHQTAKFKLKSNNKTNVIINVDSGVYIGYYAENINVELEANKEKKVTVYLSAFANNKVEFKVGSKKYTTYVQPKVAKPILLSGVKTTSNTIEFKDFIAFNDRKTSIPGSSDVEVYRSTNKNSGYKKIGNAKNTNNGFDLDKSLNSVYSYTDNNLKPGTTYYYKFRGYYSVSPKYTYTKSFYGPFSSVKKVTTKKGESSEAFQTKSGWKKESGEWYYYKNGKKLTYLQKIDGKYYYFNSKGEMQTGLIKYNKDGKYRYFFAVTNTKTNKTKGQMAVNRKLKINGEPYEFDANGICIYGKRCGITTTKKITTSTRGELTLSCPSIAHVNEQFTCTTNMAGAKISVTASGLASGYNTSFTTTNSDRTKQSKYTTEGTKTITVSKSGYTSVTRQVKVKYKLQGGHGGHYTR